MSTQAYVNIMLQAFGGLISIMIIVFVRYIRKECSQSDRLYLRFLVCNTLLLFTNALSWYLDGRPGTVNRVILVAINCILYLLHYLLLGTITSYLSSFLTKWGIECGKTVRIVWGIALFGCLTILVSQFNGMCYFIDEQNIYRRGEWFLLFPIIGIIGVIVAFSLLFSNRRQLHSKEYRTFTVLFTVAILALVLHTIYFGMVYLYLTTTFVAISIYVFIQAEQSRKLSEQALELEQSRTAIMLSQIQPHFLYNSLQGIQSLCDIDPPKASEALEHFAFYLRGNLDALSDTRLVTFEKELIHIKDYLYLEKMRFEERLSIVWELECLDFLLPPLTVQPLIENAIRHGINKKAGRGILTIRSERTAQGVVVTVRDNGVGFDPTVPKADGRAHIGIENTRSRLETLCGGTLTIESTKGVGTTATIMLPQGGTAK